MAKDLDLPIALRRTRRSSSGLNITYTASQAANSRPAPAIIATTPNRKPKPKKRVRFSDPGPLLTSTSSPNPNSTGLTPLVRRTSLAHHPAAARRHSTPARPSSSSTPDSSIRFHDSVEEVVHTPSLRQVLSGRVQRRIRRNGLSAEMNAIEADKKRLRRDLEAGQEVERLRAELAGKDAEIRRLRDEGGGRDAAGEGSWDWTVAGRDPFSDEVFMDVDDDDVGVEEFGESSLAELACSTPTRRGRGGGGMLATPPSTSPAAAARTPSSRVATPKEHVGVQVDLPDEEKERLEEELASLQLEVAKLTTGLEGYAGFMERVAAKLGAFSTDGSSLKETGSPHCEVEEQIAGLLRTLSDRTAALLELTSTISSLGFPGSDASEILNAIITAFRTARLELEYLTPGEISLPLTSSGAAVLDLLLDQLRHLARKAKEGDESIDEYHALELSLRQQLSARVDVTDALTKEVTELKKKVEERDGRLAEQSVGLDRLKGAVASYARDVSELEELVGRLEGEKSAAVETLEGRLATQTSALESRLAALGSRHAEALGDLRKGHKDEIAGLNQSHGAALALRDARVAELRGEIERVNASLRAAHETVRKLRVENEKAKGANEKLVEENKGLAEGAEADRRKAKEVVDGMRAELERVVRMSEGLLATPTKKGVAKRRDSALGGDDEVDEEVSLVNLETPSTGGGGRGSFLSGDLAKRGGDRKRRRYDSGLGFLDEEEVDR